MMNFKAFYFYLLCIFFCVSCSTNNYNDEIEIKKESELQSSDTLIDKETLDFLQKNKLVFEKEVCFLDVGEFADKDNLIGQYNLIYTYIKVEDCYKKCALVETKEGLDFLDSNSYEMLTFNISDSSTYIGKGKYKLERDSLILTFFTPDNSKEDKKMVSENFKLTAKSDTIYFQKRSESFNEEEIVYEYVRFK